MQLLIVDAYLDEDEMIKVEDGPVGKPFSEIAWKVLERE